MPTDGQGARREGGKPRRKGGNVQHEDDGIQYKYMENQGNAKGKNWEIKGKTTGASERPETRVASHCQFSVCCRFES